MSNVRKKAFAAIACIHRASQYVPAKIHKMLYNSLVLPPLRLLFNSVALLQPDTLPEPRAYTKLCNDSHSQPAPTYARCPLRGQVHWTTSIDDVTTKCCARCTGVCFSRLLSTWPGNLPRTHNSTHPPEEQTSYTSSTPAQTSLDCPSSTRVLTTTTSCHKMSDQSKAYHLLGMQ